MNEKQRRHPTGNTAINVDEEIAYVEKVRFIGELRQASNIDEIIEIVGKRFADLAQRLAASEAHALACDKLLVRSQPLASQVIELERQLAELREPMTCGHPKAYLVKVEEHIEMDIAENMHCAACEREKAQIAAAYEAACKTICVNCAEGVPLEEAGHENDRHCYAWAIRKLIDADAKAALDAQIASAEARVKKKF